MLGYARNEGSAQEPQFRGRANPTYELTSMFIGVSCSAVTFYGFTRSMR